MKKSKEMSQENVPASAAIDRDIAEKHESTEKLRESENRLRALFENAEVGIAEVAPDGRWIRTNNKLCEIVGYTQKEMSNLTFQDITHPEDLDKDLGLLQETLDGTRSTYTMEKRYIRKDGSISWIELSVSLIRHPDGTPDYFISIITDINKRKKQEAELADAELRERQAIAAGQVGLWDWSLATNEVHYSTEWKRQIGYENHEIENSFEEWRSRVHPDDLEPTEKQIQQFIAGKQSPYKIEFRFRHKNGTWRWILAQAEILLDDDGKATRILGSHMDITERKQAEAQAERERLFSESVVSSLPGVFYVIGTEYRFRRWNTNFETVTGYSHDEMSAISPIDLFTGDDKQRIADSIRQVFESGEVLVEAEFVSKSGARLPYLFTGTRVELGGESLLVGLGIDITDRKQAEKQLANHRAELEEKVEERTRELRTIVNAMAGREVRMAELKESIATLRTQLLEAGIEPGVEDPGCDEEGPTADDLNLE